MNMTALIEKLQALPENKQAEVWDFVDYLASRFGTPSAPEQAASGDQNFSIMSMSQALRGLQDEPDLYRRRI
ncbi:DUF2281 domain-containing protein [Candidatus Symbiobacter mobilis]|uniref:Uncharacterized protein n=1 Tax=Candidatus Symbiobacter mobilis CR TaxID=946483 RepID=U5N8M5_9BURK|nr:DUF2281 domain-containing protein [Candidatus Symbiobacter mobilis]AGX87757.1 hypothetical protein Cenrod_1672 [Candidatus Symbiobacter mobilis CR]